MFSPLVSYLDNDQNLPATQWINNVFLTDKRGKSTSYLHILPASSQWMVLILVSVVNYDTLQLFRDCPINVNHLHTSLTNKVIDVDLRLTSRYTKLCLFPIKINDKDNVSIKHHSFHQRSLDHSFRVLSSFSYFPNISRPWRWQRPGLFPGIPGEWESCVRFKSLSFTPQRHRADL